MALPTLSILLAALSPLVASTYLEAAPKHRSLLPRSLDLTPHRHEHTLLFGPRGSWPANDDSVLAAKIRLEPKLPTLVLDDYDEHIASVQCADGIMLVGFKHPDTQRHAIEAWSDEEFVLITSNPACAQHGHHTGFTVAALSNEYDDMTISLHAVAGVLEDLNRRMHVEYGNHIVPHLARRQDATTTSSSQATSIAVPPISITSSTTSVVPSLSTSIGFSAPTQSATGPSGANTFSLARVNTTIIPVDPVIAALVPALAVGGLTVKCLNCTASGAMAVTAAGFTISNSSRLNQAEDFFTDSGFFLLTANKVKARVELGMSVLPGFNAITVTAALPDIPIAAITIAGIIDFGLSLSPTFPVSVILNSQIDLKTGFTLSVPDNSTMRVNVSSPRGVSSTGFDRTEFKALPLDISRDDLSFNVTAAFQPIIKLSAKAAVSNAVAGGGIGVAMDLPILNTEIKKVRGSNSSCLPAADGKGAEYIKVSPSVGVGLKAFYELAAGFANTTLVEVGEEFPIFATSRPLPTSCFKWSKDGGLADPNAPAINPASNQAGTNSPAGGPGTGTASGVVVPACMMLLSVLAGCALIWA